jgi:biopolymer transport protein ExbB
MSLPTSPSDLFTGSQLLHILPLAVAGALAAGLIVERSNSLYRRLPLRNPREFFERLQDLLLDGRVSEAIQLCERQEGKPAATVVKQALMRSHQPERMIEEGLQVAILEANQSITRRTSFLATLANVATLLGLFGTIAGLIHSFQAVGHADAQQKSALLAAGISQAMNATLIGIGIAIPCMVAFSFLVSRQNQLVSELDQAAGRTLDILKQRAFAIHQDLLAETKESA